MSDTLSCDLLVIGAGPAGSAVATYAARRGIDVILADAASHPRSKACAEYASPRIAEELARIGIARAAWRAAAVPVESMRIVGRRSSFELRYADDSGARTAWGVDRMAFDALLARHAAAQGARLLEGARLAGLFRRGGRVSGARLATADGQLSVTTRLVVGADGARSATARLLGVERPVGWPRRLGLVAHHAGVTALDGQAEMHVGDGLYVGLAPTPGGRVNVGMALGMRAAREPASERFDAALAALPAVAARLRGSERVSRITGTAPIGHRVSDVAGAGWLLVGDAAGFIDPFTGEGIFRALRGARAAAAAIELAHRGDDPGAVAERYRADRRSAFAAKDLLTWLIQGFLASPPLFEYAAARLARRRSARVTLGSALGDVRPAADALSPLFLASVLRP
ncbi:MAG: NAD(P)/FAD-dependent oxidoreductase [Candidatus Limnocylindria bacterium]